MKQLLVLSIITSSLTAFSLETFAQGIGYIMRPDKAFKDVQKLDPGSTVLIQLGKGKSPKDAVKKGIVDQTKVIVSGSQQIGAIDQKTEDKIKKAVGPDAAKVIEIVRLPEKLDRAMAIEGTISAANAAEHQKIDLKELATAPFAA